MTKDELIRELLNELNIKERIIGGLDYLYTTGRVDNELWRILNKKVDENAESLMSQLIKFYDEKFTFDEIQNVLVFVKTKSGKRILDILTGGDGELIELSSNWLKELIEESIEERERNILKERVERGISWRDYVPPLDTKLY